MLYELDGVGVRAEGDYWVADRAAVMGSVLLRQDASVWFNAVVRGDNDQITIGGDSVFGAVEFPALFTGLDTGLTDMDRDTFCEAVSVRNMAELGFRFCEKDETKIRRAKTRLKRTRLIAGCNRTGSKELLA